MALSDALKEASKTLNTLYNQIANAAKQIVIAADAKIKQEDDSVNVRKPRTIKRYVIVCDKPERLYDLRNAMEKDGWDYMKDEVYIDMIEAFSTTFIPSVVYIFFGSNAFYDSLPSCANTARGGRVLTRRTTKTGKLMPRNTAQVVNDLRWRIQGGFVKNEIETGIPVVI